MAIRAIVGIVALACVSACAIIVTFAHYEMMDKVNEKLPNENDLIRLAGIGRRHNDFAANTERMYPKWAPSV
jgi:hypothetical protein